MRGFVWLAVAGAIGGLICGCDQGDGIDNPPPKVNCSQCHGSPGNPAPPPASTGETSTDSLEVGAHDTHMLGGELRGPVECSECHRVPARVEDGCEDQGPAEVEFGKLASFGGLEPSWDRESASCQNVYCHGASLEGGSNTQPIWTQMNQDQIGCGSCHGLPPAWPHLPRTDCQTCHQHVSHADMSFVRVGPHINGARDVTRSCSDCHVGCSGCHGFGQKGLPPPSLSSASDPSDLGVGAHESHLKDGRFRKAVACRECHLVPRKMSDANHLDPPPAEVSFGSLACDDGLDPAWDREAARCSNTYCHGNSLGGGTLNEPVWTRVDGTQADCGTCHSTPPPDPHPQMDSCHRCHLLTVNQSDQIYLAGGLHMNGRRDVVVPVCGACHGDVDNQAPPPDLQGNTDTGSRGVGAHREHLELSDWRREIDCQECHLVPAEVEDPGHLDSLDLVSELTWGPLATADGAQPGFDPDSLSCSNVYCHGATLKYPGGLYTQPDWTRLDGAQADCDACHGNPPGGRHPGSSNCENCHGEVIGPDDAWVAPERHIDGVLDVETTCNRCHGNPPTPASESYPGGGGAHLRHQALGHGCAICHGHEGDHPTHQQGGALVLQSNVNLVFDRSLVFPGGSTIANGGTPRESYNGGQPTCWVGCHNPVPGDVPELTNQATWTDTSISCSECHERPGTSPPLNHHLERGGSDDQALRAACRECHGMDKHLSGSVEIVDPDPSDSDSYQAGQVSGLCRTCHDGGPGTFFGGATPQDVSSFWTLPSSHQEAGKDCSDCHTHHGKASGEVLVSREEHLCFACHDGQTASTDMAGLFARPSSHPVDDAAHATWTLECTHCHNPHANTGLQPYIPDPDPDDGIVPVGLDENYCLTCHDGQQASDRTMFADSAHFQNTAGCIGECHVKDAGFDGSPSGPSGPHASVYPSLTQYHEEEICRQCHSEVEEMSDAHTPTHHHVVDAEQTGNQPLECTSCHEVHTDKNSPWQPIIDPNTGLLMPEADVPHDSSLEPDLAQLDNQNFCLTCHDGSWPGAADIAAELADQNVVNSSWVINSKNKHFSHDDDPNANNGEVACTYCHDSHGSTGTSGIQRGMTLYDWLTVNEFPYSAKGSCSTADPLGVCH